MLQGNQHEPFLRYWNAPCICCPVGLHCLVIGYWAGDAGIRTPCAQPYIFHNDLIALYQVIQSHSKGYAPASQQTVLDEAAKIIRAESREAGDLAAARHFDDNDDELR